MEKGWMEEGTDKWKNVGKINRWAAKHTNEQMTEGWKKGIKKEGSNGGIINEGKKILKNGKNMWKNKICKTFTT